MASLIVRENARGTSYLIRWGRDTGRASETFFDRASAEQFKSLVELHGGWPPGWTPGVGFAVDRGLATFAQAAEAFLAAREATAGSAAHAGYKAILEKQFLPRWRTWAVEDIKLRDVQAWIAERGKTVTSKTLGNEHGVLSGVMQQAQREGWRIDNPCTLTTKPKARKTERIDNLTPPQFAVLLECAKEDVRPLMLTAVGTGLRFSELVALTPASIITDHTGTRIRVHQAFKREADEDGVMRRVLGAPKTTKSFRDVYVAGQLAAMLRELASRGGQWLFPTKHGNAWRYSTFHGNRWAPAVEAARLKDPSIPDPCRFHFLRHSYAWWSLSAGSSLAELQEQMGHESILMTKNVYGGLNPMARAASAQWPAAVTDTFVMPAKALPA